MAALTWLGSNIRDELVDLGPLMLLAPLLHELNLQSIIDQHLPADPQLEFSHGKILSLLLSARVCQPTALVNIAAWAEQCGADILWNIPADKLNDDRLGRALDAFFPNRHSIQAHVTQRVLQYVEWQPHRLHFDTTHVTFCGDYQSSKTRSPVNFELPFPSDNQLSPAHITKGYLTDQRMIQVGMTAAIDELGAVPIFCHPLDGNRNGHTAIHESFELLRKHLPPTAAGTQLVSDRGTFSAEHIARLRRHDYHVLCTVPWNDVRSLYDTHMSQLEWHNASYLSIEQQRRREATSSLPQEHYEIAAVPHQLIDPETKKPLDCRVLFVYSTSGEKEAQTRRQKNIDKIRSGLDALAAKLLRGNPQTSYESVVRQITKLLGKKDAARYFSWELVPLSTAEQQALPTPKRGHTRPSHRLVYNYDAAQADADVQYDGLFALLATAPEPKTSDELFTEYKQQCFLELDHHQFKTPLAVSPVFLKSPRRVEALICLMHMALQIYQVMERRYRQRTPANAPVTERRRTAESLLRTFASYGILLRSTPIGRTLHATRMNRRQTQILDRLGLPTPNQFFAKILQRAPTG